MLIQAISNHQQNNIKPQNLCNMTAKAIPLSFKGNALTTSDKIGFIIHTGVGNFLRSEAEKFTKNLMGRAQYKVERKFINILKCIHNHKI